MEEPQSGFAAMGKQDYEPSIAESNVKSVYSHASNSSFDHLVKVFKEYQPKSTIIDINKLRNSSALKLKKFRESAYYGEIVNSKRHGLGIMLYQNERVYEGNWQCDYKQGLGFEQFPNGSIYYGQYINGKPEGVGKYTWNNGEFYEGQWINGLKHGSGMWKGCKGDSYVGEWKMGKADGYGVHVWVNGDRYQGDFKACLKHGQGTQKFAKGDLYKGEYQRGKPNGYGQYYWSNGSYFKGNFKQGLRHGHGMWKKGSGNSDKYEGQYNSDKKQGYGIFTWSTGNIYKGNYNEDLRSDFGEMYWSDGSYYKGQWKGGIQHGEGLLYVPGQGTKKGRFENNQLVELFQQENNKITQPTGAQIRITQLPPQHHINHKSLEGRRKVNTSYDAARGNIRITREARPLVPMPHKQQSLRVVERKKTHTVQLERAVTNGGNINPRKQRIPHSAYYMHKLHERVSTANNDSNSHSSFVQTGKNRGEIVDQLKSFTRKIVGRLPSRFSSNKN